MKIQFKDLNELKQTVEKAISTNGYFIKTEEAVPIRSAVALFFSVSGSEHELELRAEVVYSGGGGIGFHFIENPESIRAKYVDFLATASGSQVKKDENPESATDTVKPKPVAMPPSPLQEAKADPDLNQTPQLPEEPSVAAPQTPPVPPIVQPEPQIAPQTLNVIRGKMKNILKLETNKKAGEKDLLGDFGDLSFSKMLINIFEGKTTGIIRFTLGEDQKVVYCRKGRPVFVESIPPIADESIGHILLAKEKLKKEGLDDAIKYVEENGVRIGEAMLALKLVSPTLLKDALTYQLKVKIYELFKWKESDFEMEIMNSLGQKFGTRPINVINTVWRGLKEKLKELYPADLEKYFTPIYDKYLLRKENFIFDLENLGFSNNEKRFWELLLHGKKRLRQIFEGSTMNKPDTYRFLYSLFELDMININDTATLDIPNIERDLYNQARFIEKMNYFDALAVHWSVNTQKIEKSYKQHLEEILEKKKIPNISEKAIEDIDRIAACLKKAFETLSSESVKREYRKQILGDTEAKVAAELAARQAQLMEFKNDTKEAKELIEVALDLDPGNSEYRKLYRKYGGR